VKELDRPVLEAWEKARKWLAFPWILNPEPDPTPGLWPTWLVGRKVFYHPETISALSQKSGFSLEAVYFEEFVHQIAKALFCPGREWVRVLKIIREETGEGLKETLFYLTAFLDFVVSCELARRSQRWRAEILARSLQDGFITDPSLGQVLAKALAVRLGKPPKTRFPLFIEGIVNSLAHLPYRLPPSSEEVRSFVRALVTLFNASEPASTIKKEVKDSLDHTLVGSVYVPPDVAETLDSGAFLQEKEVQELGEILLRIAPDGEIIAAIAPWRKYLAMAEAEDIRLPEVPNRAWGEAFPVEKRAWEIGDSVLDLEPFSPFGTKIIPGLTKRRHRRSQETGFPDALIVQDASGSLQGHWNPFEFSPAVLGGICIARAFFRAGSQVAALNTSNREIYCRFTHRSEATSLYKIIAAFQGGGEDRIEEKTLDLLLHSHCRETVAFVFTDTSLWEPCTQGLRYLQRHAARTHLFLFLLPGHEQIPKHISALASNNFHIHPIKDWESLRAVLKQILSKNMLSHKGC